MAKKVIYKTLALLLLAMIWQGPVQAEPDLVILVRHAEKATDTDKSGDPGLSVAGQARALALKEALQFSGIGKIITTQYRRTRETAQQIAAATGVTAEVIDARGSAHIGQVVAAVRASSGTVLVVGHSNTVPAIATALGAPAMQEFCESSFSHMLLVRPIGKSAQFIHAQYGTVDTAATAAKNCQ